MKTTQPAEKKSYLKLSTPASPSDAAFVAAIDGEIRALSSTDSTPKAGYFFPSEASAASHAQPKPPLNACAAAGNTPIFVPLSSPASNQATRLCEDF